MELRFLLKLNGRITAVLLAAVMLLSFFTSCSKDKREVVAIKFDPEKSYTMRAINVSSLISDSGVTRYRMNTKLWYVYGKAKDPHWFFPKGVFVEKFDTLFHSEASMKADTAYFYNQRGLWELDGHVVVKSLKGERFDTSQLFWDQKAQKVFSNRDIRIQQQEKIIMGKGFESNQEMTEYKIFNTKGVFPINDSPELQGEPTNDSIPASAAARLGLANNRQ